MNYRIELLEGINSWTREEYRDACGSLIRGLELITKLSPSTFFLAGVTPGTNLLGTICEGLNEGDMLWKRLHHVFSKQAFPLGSFHVGWMTSLQAILFEVTLANWILTRNAKHGSWLNMQKLNYMYYPGNV